jgi:hypothetical protein
MIVIKIECPVDDIGKRLELCILWSLQMAVTSGSLFVGDNMKALRDGWFLFGLLLARLRWKGDNIVVHF